MNIKLAQAYWVLNLLPSDKLPDIAVSALELGSEANALQMLAGLSPDETDEARALFERSLKELGIPAVSASDAANIVAVEISKQIVRGDLSPEEGANKLWEVSIHVGDKAFHDLDSFIYAASEIKSRPHERNHFNQEIVKEAEWWASKSLHD